VVFLGHLSARAAFRLEPSFTARQEIARNPPLCVASYLGIINGNLRDKDCINEMLYLALND